MEIVLKDGEKIELKLKGKHTKKLMKCYAELSDEDTNTGKAMIKYTDELDKIICEVTEKTQEQLDEMDADDKNAISNKIQGKALGQLDFIKSSLK